MSCDSWLKLAAMLAKHRCTSAVRHGFNPSRCQGWLWSFVTKHRRRATCAPATTLAWRTIFFMTVVQEVCSFPIHCCAREYNPRLDHPTKSPHKSSWWRSLPLNKQQFTYSSLNRISKNHWLTHNRKESVFIKLLLLYTNFIEMNNPFNEEY